MNRKSRSVGRRSSILKIDLQNQDDNTAVRSRVSSRRVSFAETCQVKEFPRESPRHFKHIETDEEDSANQDQAPPLKSKSITGLDTLLTGTIQSHPCQDVLEYQLTDMAHSSFMFDINKTTLDTVDMDMTEVCGDVHNDSNMDVDFQPEPSIEIKSFLQSLKAMPSKSMATPIYTSHKETLVYSDQSLGLTLSSRSQVRSPLETLPISANSSFHHPEKENMVPLAIMSTTGALPASINAARKNTAGSNKLGLNTSVVNTTLEESMMEDESEDTSPILDAKAFLSNLAAKFGKKDSGPSVLNSMLSSKSSASAASLLVQNNITNVGIKATFEEEMSVDIDETKCVGADLVEDKVSNDTDRYTDATKYFPPEDQVGLEETKCIGGIIKLNDVKSVIGAKNVGLSVDIPLKGKLQRCDESDIEEPFAEEKTRFFGDKTIALEETKCIGGILDGGMTSILNRIAPVAVLNQSTCQGLSSGAGTGSTEECFEQDKTVVMDVGVEETRCVGTILNETEVVLQDNVTKVLPVGLEITRCVGGILDASEIESEQRGHSGQHTEHLSKSETISNAKSDNTVSEINFNNLSPLKKALQAKESETLVNQNVTLVDTEIDDGEEATTQAYATEGDTTRLIGLGLLRSRLSAIGTDKSVRMEEKMCQGELLAEYNKMRGENILTTNKTICMSEVMEETVCVGDSTSNDFMLKSLAEKNDVTRMDSIGMEETQCVGALKEEVRRKEDEKEVMGKKNNIYIEEKLKLDEHGHVLSEKCDLDIKDVEKAQLEMPIISGTNSVAKPVAETDDNECRVTTTKPQSSEAKELQVTKGLSVDNVLKQADTTTDLLKRRSLGVNDLRKQLLHMGSKTSNKLNTTKILCEADSTIPLPDSTSRVSDAGFLSGRVDSTTQLLNVNLTGGPFSTTQILDSCRTAITDSTEMLLASHPSDEGKGDVDDNAADVNDDEDDNQMKGASFTLEAGHQVTDIGSAKPESSPGLDASIKYTSPDLEFGEEPGLDDVLMPEGMEGLPEGGEADTCPSTNTVSSNISITIGNNDTRNSTYNNLSLLSNKSFAIPDGPLTLDTLFRHTYRPTQSINTCSRYSIVPTHKIDYEDMSDVLQAEICLGPLVKAKKKMTEQIKDRSEKNKVNIELLHGTLEETQPQLFSDFRQADKQEVMKIAEQMKALHSYCFKEAELAWNVQTGNMYSEVAEILKSSGQKRAEEVVEEIVSNSATVDNFISTVDQELEELEKLDRLLEELQEKETSLKRENEVNAKQIEEKECQQQQTLSKQDLQIKLDTLFDQRLHLQQAIAAHIRCSNWHLQQYRDDLLLLSFCDGQLLLQVNLQEGFSDRKIQQISLRSQLYKKRRRLCDQVLHDMVLSGIDSSSLQVQFSSFSDLPKMIETVSRTIGEIENFCKDVNKINCRYKLLYRNKCFSIDLYKRSLTLVSLHLIFDAARPQSSPAKISTQVSLGDINSDELSRKLEMVPPGPCYLSRLVAACELGPS